MIRIWLCDDEKLFLEQEAACLRSILGEKSIDFQISTFDDAESLLKELKNITPDLLLLDLVLGDAAGYDVAECICRRAVQTEMVFVTNYPQRMPEAFVYKPMGFLPKPVSECQMRAMLERFLFFYRQRNVFYTVITRSCETRIPIGEILYFESVSHHIHLHRADGTETLIFTGKLDDIENELSSLSFVRCHKSFLVSTMAIERIDRREMTICLVNGRKIPVSRRCYKTVSLKFTEDKMR